MTLVLKHAHLAGVTTPNERCRAGSAMRQIGVIADGAVVVSGDRIAWLGPTAELPPLPSDAVTFDVSGNTIVPGFVDSHTHLLFAGDRVAEWEQRLGGATYQQIAAAGGGILSTVRAVRSSSREELVRLAQPRLRRLLSFGVTTAEIKSGYGLSTKDEIRCLEAIHDLDQKGPIEIVPTFLGAHDVPAEYRTDRAKYVDLVCEEMLPEVARCRLARFCDVFCEAGVFSAAESERILRRGQDLGLGVKVHADELTCLDGAVLAARLGATSADHLLQVSEAGIDALANSGTVATLLPGTALFLNVDFAPARKLIDRGVTVALATDCNPGTCPCENLPLSGSLACMAMGMLPAEALNALTLNAACALGVSDRVGSLAVGKQADFVLCDVPDYRHIFYHFGVNHVRRVFKRGRLVWDADAPCT